jgi:adenylate kinase
MISIIGTPGAGKTTQTKLLAEYLGCPWFSQGELIRQHATGTARQAMMEGKIIDDTVTLKILDDALRGVDTSDAECIVEGSPRTLAQAEWWEKKIDSGAFKITGFIHLVVDEKLAEQRLAKRGRLDDYDDKVIRKRFAEYQANTKQAIEYLNENGWPVYEINAADTIEQIADNIKKTLGAAK